MSMYNPSEFFSAEHPEVKETTNPILSLSNEEIAFVLSQLSNQTEKFWLEWLNSRPKANTLTDEDLTAANFEL